MNDDSSTLDAQDAVFPVRFIVQFMALFRESLAQWAPERRDGSQNENGTILHILLQWISSPRWSEVLPQSFVESAVKLLVTQFIPLKPNDLEAWMQDPEDWVNLEEKEEAQWEFELRVSASFF
jgi:hypothetical protein